MEDDPSSILSFHEQEDDALSLCDLSPTTPFDPEVYYDSSSFPSPSKQDAFEFSSVNGSTAETVSHADTILFCGRAIPFEKQPAGYLMLRSNSSSFNRHGSFRRDSGNALLERSGSMAVPVVGSCRYSTGSTRASSGRKYKALIGVTKFPSRMDMGEIRKRQNRQAPTPLFPSGGESALAIAADGELGQSRHWGLLRLLRCRSSRCNLMSTLARASFSCIRHVS